MLYYAVIVFSCLQGYYVSKARLYWNVINRNALKRLSPECPSGWIPTVYTQNKLTHTQTHSLRSWPLDRLTSPTA